MHVECVEESLNKVCDLCSMGRVWTGINTKSWIKAEKAEWAVRRVTATHQKTHPEETSPGIVVLFHNKWEDKTLESLDAIWRTHTVVEQPWSSLGKPPKTTAELPVADECVSKGGGKPTAWRPPPLNLYTSKLLLLHAGWCALTLASVSPIQATFQFQSQAGTHSCSPNSSPSDRSDGYNTLRGEAGGEKSEKTGGFSGEKIRECCHYVQCCCLGLHSFY